jgi:hypothetical protein
MLSSDSRALPDQWAGLGSISDCLSPIESLPDAHWTSCSHGTRDKLIIAHGACIEKDAKPFVEQAFQWLRRSGACARLTCSRVEDVPVSRVNLTDSYD